MKKDDLLKQHPYKIFKKKGLWTTWIPCEKTKEGRRQISRKNLEDLQKEIIKSLKEGQRTTIEEIFEDFLDRKIKQGIRLSTKTRYFQVFNRHFKETGWNKKDIRYTSSYMFSEFLEDEVLRCDLTSKSFSSLKLILKGIIKTARKKELISYNMDDILFDVDVKLKKNPKKPEEQTLTEEELPALIDYLLENRDTKNLCILLMVLSGIRTGELVGLKYSDFKGTRAKIRRAETKWQDAEGGWHYEITEPKTEAGVREIFIPADYSWILKDLKKLNPKAEFLAVMDDGKTRLHTYSIRWRLYRICEKIEVFQKRKSPHKLRKTFCSILLDGGFDQNLIISIMGHTDISTTEQFYHFDRKKTQEKQKMINAASNLLSGGVVGGLTDFLKN